MGQRVYPQNRPAYPPYHPATMPWYMDLFWSHFKGRPFALSGSYGFTGNQVDTTGVNITTANSAAQGGVSVTLQTGQGSYFTPGEPIILGTGNVGGNVNWQSATIQSVAGDTLNFFPRIAPAAGWPAGTQVNHAWGNASHPAYTNAWQAWGFAIANAKQRRNDGRYTIMPPNGAGHGNDLGSMDDPGTVGGVANVPAGWAPIGNTSNISCVTSVYGTADFQPHARTNNGVSLRAANASGSGIATNIPIPVKPGTDYTLSVNGKNTSETLGFQIIVVDATTTSIVVGSYPLWLFGDENTANLGTRTTIQFTVPGGTTAIQIQLVSQTATDVCYFDNFRLQESRQSPLYDRYIIEADPENRPIVMLGDSWTAGTTGGWLGFTQAIQARLGSQVQVINCGVSGQTVAQCVSRMVTSNVAGVPPVTPFYPRYCVLGMGMQNDMAQNIAQATVTAALASFIDTCRQYGIVPVIPGVAPTSSTLVTGDGGNALLWAHDLNDACRNQCALVTQ